MASVNPRSELAFQDTFCSAKTPMLRPIVPEPGLLPCGDVITMPKEGALADRNFAVRLMEHLVVPTFVLEPAGTVLIWNRACERLTGVAASEVLGSREHWKAFYEAPRPCLADIVLQGTSAELLYAEITRADSVSLSAENWCVMPKLGSRRYLALDAGPIHSESGELLAVVETLRDITVQHEAQTTLKSLASLDGLTGLSNRRAFDQTLEQECHRAQRDETAISLMMIDIDEFKTLNDTLGHQAGDDCLKHLARVIGGEALRPGDLAARYGGEEFAVILPATPPRGASMVANRIASGVELLASPHPSSPSGIVTVSIGVGTSNAAISRHPEVLIAAADAALYRAKREGRNRIAVQQQRRASAA